LSDAYDPTQHIQVEVRTIEQHFTGQVTFRLPWFQRAYAWSEEHATRLLRDILEASKGGRGRYFLGSVMLAVQAGDTAAALIDGHQRTLTLTILFALLRDRIKDPVMSGRLDRLVSISTASQQSPPAFRVTPQPINADCFRTYVQEIGATLREPQDNLHDFLESERNFLNNRGRLAEVLDEHAPDEAALIGLATFILDRCTMVIQTVEDEDEAWEMLSIEESTGLPFHSSERSKVALITVMQREVQEEAGRTWDVWQARLGADGMARLLGHVRTLKATRTSSKPIEQELVELYDLREADLRFIEKTLVPHAARYLAIRRADLGSGAARAEISSHIETLNWLNREFWVPPALCWLDVHGAEHPDTAALLRHLDRLAWLMRIAGRDPVDQERRFRRISVEIKAGTAIQDIKDLKVDQKILALARENLLSRTFYDKSYARLVLRRLSLLTGQDCGPIDGDQATVEHVLPRRPPKGSPWYTNFKNKKTVDHHAHRLGNLAVLTFWENQEAGAKPLPEKQPILAASRFVLARKCAAQQDWTPATITARTEELARTLLEGWDIEYPGG
jgi:hypothetical protein